MGMGTGMGVGMGRGMDTKRVYKVGVGMGGMSVARWVMNDECRWCGLQRFSLCFVKKGLPIAEIFHALPDLQDLHLVVPVHEFCKFNPWRDSQTIAKTRVSCTVS